MFSTEVEAEHAGPWTGFPPLLICKALPTVFPGVLERALPEVPATATSTFNDVTLPQPLLLPLPLLPDFQDLYAGSLRPMVLCIDGPLPAYSLLPCMARSRLPVAHST